MVAVDLLIRLCGRVAHGLIHRPAIDILVAHGIVAVHQIPLIRSVGNSDIDLVGIVVCGIRDQDQLHPGFLGQVDVHRLHLQAAVLVLYGVAVLVHHRDQAGYGDFVLAVEVQVHLLQVVHRHVLEQEVVLLLLDLRTQGRGQQGKVLLKLLGGHVGLGVAAVVVGVGAIALARHGGPASGALVPQAHQILGAVQDYPDVHHGVAAGQLLGLHVSGSRVGQDEVLAVLRLGHAGIEAIAGAVDRGLEALVQLAQVEGVLLIVELLGLQIASAHQFVEVALEEVLRHLPGVPGILRRVLRTGAVIGGPDIFGMLRLSHLNGGCHNTSRFGIHGLEQSGSGLYAGNHAVGVHHSHDIGHTVERLGLVAVGADAPLHLDVGSLILVGDVEAADLRHSLLRAAHGDNDILRYDAGSAAQDQVGPIGLSGLFIVGGVVLGGVNAVVVADLAAGVVAGGVQQTIAARDAGRRLGIGVFIDPGHHGEGAAGGDQLGQNGYLVALFVLLGQPGGRIHGIAAGGIPRLHDHILSQGVHKAVLAVGTVRANDMVGIAGIHLEAAGAGTLMTGCAGILILGVVLRQTQTAQTVIAPDIDGLVGGQGNVVGGAHGYGHDIFMLAGIGIDDRDPVGDIVGSAQRGLVVALVIMHAVAQLAVALIAPGQQLAGVEHGDGVVVAVIELDDLLVGLQDIIAALIHQIQRHNDGLLVDRLAVGVDLAVVVVAPAPEGAVVADDTHAVAAGTLGDVDDLAHADHLLRRVGEGAAAAGAVGQLTIRVVAPGVHPARLGEDQSVVQTRHHLDGRAVSGAAVEVVHQSGRVGVPGVAHAQTQLAIGVVAPGVHTACLGHGHSMVVAHRHQSHLIGLGGNVRAGLVHHGIGGQDGVKVDLGGYQSVGIGHVVQPQLAGGVVAPAKHLAAVADGDVEVEAGGHLRRHQGDTVVGGISVSGQSGHVVDHVLEHVAIFIIGGQDHVGIAVAVDGTSRAVHQGSVVLAGAVDIELLGGQVDGALDDVVAVLGRRHHRARSEGGIDHGKGHVGGLALYGGLGLVNGPIHQQVEALAEHVLHGHGLILVDGDIVLAGGLTLLAHNDGRIAQGVVLGQDHLTCGVVAGTVNKAGGIGEHGVLVAGLDVGDLDTGVHDIALVHSREPAHAGQVREMILDLGGAQTQLAKLIVAEDTNGAVVEQEHGLVVARGDLHDTVDLALLGHSGLADGVSRLIAQAAIRRLAPAVEAQNVIQGQGVAVAGGDVDKAAVLIALDVHKGGREVGGRLHTQLQVIVAARGVQVAVPGQDQSVVGAGGDVSHVLDVHQSGRIDKLAHRVGAKGQLTLAVVAPSVQVTLFGHGEGVTVAGGHLDHLIGDRAAAVLQQGRIGHAIGAGGQGIQPDEHIQITYAVGLAGQRQTQLAPVIGAGHPDRTGAVHQ